MVQEPGDLSACDPSLKKFLETAGKSSSAPDGSLPWWSNARPRRLPDCARSAPRSATCASRGSGKTPQRRSEYRQPGCRRYARRSSFLFLVASKFAHRSVLPRCASLNCPFVGRDGRVAPVVEDVSALFMCQATFPFKDREVAFGHRPRGQTLTKQLTTT